MIRGFLVSYLAILVGCIVEDDPHARVKPLSSLPPPRLLIQANLRKVTVFIELDAFDVKGCPVLDDSFAASLHGTPMEIAHRGTSIDSIYSSDPCLFPRLVLENPPASASAAIEMTYPKHSIAVDLLDLLAPRSAQLVPDGPWTFTPGETITLQWSPAEDLDDHVPTVYFVTDDSPQTGIRYTLLPVTVTDDRLTFALPREITPGSLQITLRKRGAITVPNLECTGATCQLLETPQIVQHIAWRTAPAR